MSGSTKIVVVGGVAGGATAAARARRVNADAEITILEKGPVVSFANCGLPYHLGGEIKERSKLLVATAELFWNRFRIQVRSGHYVNEIDPTRKLVRGTVQSSPFELPYDKLILSTGSEPIRPDFCKVQADNLFQLWTLDDMDRILEFLNHHVVKSATVVGAGFVGLEVVEQLHLRGIKITLVERLPQVLGPLDVEMARMIEAELEKHNVDLQLDASVSQLISSGGQISHVILGDGRQHPADLIIVGAGVRPRVELAMQAGLTIGGAGGVQVNQFCQTSDPNIYAAGDMIEYQHGVLGRPMRIPLAGPANRSGRVAGEHAGCGKSSGMPPVQGTSIVRVFGLSAGTTGLNERMCRAHNIDHRCATIQATHHASYFPGAKNMTLKLIYSPKDGRILGAQAVGEEGIDKRLDVVATALHFRGTVNDLAGLDLAYAPPFGSAKDPIHMAAFVAQNDLATAPSLLPSDADLEDLQIVDVRNSGEIAKLPLVGAVHIPVDEFSDRWQSLDPNRPTVVVCHSGKRAHVAACHLRGMGFANVKNLNGGISIRTLFRR